MSQENVEAVLRLSEANDRRDWDAVFDAYASDIEWEDCSGLWGDRGVARGHEGLRQAWRRWFEIFGDVKRDLDGDPSMRATTWWPPIAFMGAGAEAA